MEVVYHILRYLKLTPGKWLMFRKTTNRGVEVYSDPDWAGSILDKRSISEYCSLEWGNLVTWCSKKQSVVSRSNAEVEFRAMTQGLCEGIWLRRLLQELQMTIAKPVQVLCDNQSAINIAKNPVHYDRKNM